VGAEQEVLGDGHERKEATALGHLHDAELDPAMRRHPCEVFAAEQHAAATRGQQPRDHADGRALARGVGPHQRHHLAIRHLDGDREERLQVAVEGVDTLKPEQG
jgi:hypothetical protein